MLLKRNYERVVPHEILIHLSGPVPSMKCFELFGFRPKIRENSPIKFMKSLKNTLSFKREVILSTFVQND